MPRPLPPTPSTVSYHHTQPGWVVLVSLGVGVALMLGVSAAAGLPALALPAGLLALIGVFFASLTLHIDDREFRFRFGPGPFGKRIPLGELRSWRPVTNRWYHGWGIHGFGGGILYNVSGMRAVELQLADGTRLRVGSDEPEAVCRALTERLGEPAPLSAADEARAQRRARRALWMVLSGVALVFAGLGVLLALQARPCGLRVDAGALVVETPFYGDRVALRSLTAVSLEERLPTIRVRTNGFALGPTLRGYFRLDAWGDGRLFIEADRPPFVLLRTPDSFVVVNAPEPGATRRLYEEIVRVREGGRP